MSNNDLTELGNSPERIPEKQLSQRPALKPEASADRRLSFANTKGLTATNMLDLHEKDFEDIEIEVSEDGSEDGNANVITFNSEEPWINGFVDLIYVATIMKISELLYECGNHIEVWIMAAVYFALMFMTRHNIDMFSVCMKATDLHHRLVFLLYCLGVFLMTLNIAQRHVGGHEGGGEHTEYYYESHGGESAGETSLGETTHESSGGHRMLFTSDGVNYLGECHFEQDYVYGFAAGFVFTRFSMVCLYLLSISRSHNTEHVTQHILKLVPCLCSLIVMSCAFGGLSPYIIFAVAGLVEMVVTWVPQLFVTVHAIPKAEVIQERLGLFFMLVLGEAMIGMLKPNYDIENTRESYLDLIFSFFLMFSMGMQFFDTVHRSTEMDQEVEHKLLNRIKISLNKKLEAKIQDALSDEKIYDGEARDARRKQLKHSFEFVDEFRVELKERKEEMEEKIKAYPFEHALCSMNPIIRISYVWLHCTVSFFMLIATNGFVDLYTSSATLSHQDSNLDELKLAGGLFIVVILMIVMRGCHFKRGPIDYWMMDYPRIIFKLCIAIVHLMGMKIDIPAGYCLLYHSCIAFFDNFVELGWHALNTYYGINDSVGDALTKVADKATKVTHKVSSVSSKVTGNVFAMVHSKDSNSDCGDIETK